MYREAAGPVNGFARFAENPTVTIDFDAGDQIVGVIGSFSTTIRNIGFYMRSGRQYGTYGGPGGAEFNILQVTYGIFGSGSSSYNALTSIGVWTDPPSPPPAPPRSPAPPPPPPGPSTGPRPVRVAFMPYSGDIFYDDGFSTGEKPSPLRDIVTTNPNCTVSS